MASQSLTSSQGSHSLASSHSSSSTATTVPIIVPKSEAEVKSEFQKAVQALIDSNVGQKDKLEFLNKLVELSEHINDVKKLTPIHEFIKSVRPFVVHQSKTLRTASLRVLRYYMKTEEFLAEVLNQKLHYFIMRSLERDKQGEAERMQALKLLRKILELAAPSLPANVVHSLVSISEYHEDNFCRVSVETITEIAIRNPPLAAHCGALKVLMNSMLEPNYSSIQESLVLAYTYLMTAEETRKYIRPEFDLGVLLAPLTDNFNVSVLSKEAFIEREKKWTMCIKAVASMLKNFTGLISLTGHPLGLKALVEGLRLPCRELHEKILDALFDVFRLSVSKNANPFKKFNAQLQSNDENSPDVGTPDLPSRTRGERHNLLNNYLSALLIAFIDAGLVEALVELGSQRRSNATANDDKEENSISIKATLLLGELLFLTNTLLPSSQCARVQTLPVLMEYAATSRAGSMVTNLHQYHHLKHTSSFYDFHLALIVTGANKWKRLKGRNKTQDKLDAVKMQIDFSMEIDQLKFKLNETQVLATKDFQKWKWEIISDLLEGPLNNPTLITYAFQKTKFIKRILSYLRPSKKAFSKMAWNAQHLKYVRMACQLLESLVSTDTGRDLLMSNKLIAEIADLLKKELELGATKPTQPEDPRVKEARLLSPEKVLKTMAREYFTMLGTLSSNPRGLEVLSKFQVMKLLIELSEVQGRDDLSHLIMTSLDYNQAGDSRVILSKALTSASKVVRFLATRHMRVLLRAGVQDFYDWGIEFLVKQLNDPDQKVATLALGILDEACDEQECLDSLIAKKPNLLKMGESGKNLTLRFLSRFNGFKYLTENNFVSEELKQWKEKLNISYVNALESGLAELFSPSLYKQRETETADGVFLPPHLYGELAKTKEGCDLLKATGHVSEFIASVKNPKGNALERRAAIWVLGHIGSSKTGYQFLEEKDNVVKTLVELTETSANLSIRGTCFYALGMLSKVEAAREVLYELGWESPTNLNSCISVPKDNAKNSFLKAPVYTYVGSFAQSGTIEYENSNSTLQNEILTSVTHLSNFISAESASRTLKKLKAQHPEEFSTPKMVRQVFNLLGIYKFRLPVRRFIYDVFGEVNFADPQMYEKLLTQ